MAILQRSKEEFHITNNVHWQPTKVSREAREHMHKHKSAVVWLTGLSGAGKSTLALQLEWRLYQQGIHTYLLDGDNVRFGLNADLGFSLQDRQENIRRIGHLAKLFVDAGIVVIVALISPLRKDREWVRSLFHSEEFIETYIDCPLEVCMERDPKGLYKKAMDGTITEFTGISSPYEHPLHPELTIHTDKSSVDDAVHTIEQHLFHIILPNQKTHQAI